MVARSLSTAVAVGFASLLSVALSPLSAAQAAYPSWSAYSAQSPRAQFRPWNRSERQQPVSRWRPQAAAPRALNWPSAERRPVAFGAQQSRRVFNTGGMTRRYAAAKAPLQRPGVRFRPDDRERAADTRGAHEDATAEWLRTGPGAQFRPAEKRQRASYEQIQAAAARSGPMAAAPYGGYPAPLAMPPIYGGYWPRW
jgi:hypothetical protein